MYGAFSLKRGFFFLTSWGLTKCSHSILSHMDVTRSLEELLIINMVFIFLALCHLTFFSFVWNRRHQFWRLADTLMKRSLVVEWVALYLCFHVFSKSSISNSPWRWLASYFPLENIHKSAQDGNLTLTMKAGQRDKSSIGLWDTGDFPLLCLVKVKLFSIVLTQCLRKHPKPKAEAMYPLLSFPQFIGTLIFFFQPNNRICHRIRILSQFMAQKICNPLFFKGKFLTFFSLHASILNNQNTE